MIRPLILVTNDDGVASPALGALAEALLPLGEVHVVAPDREQSAVGHGISMHRPLRATAIREHWHSVDGTPADCVLLAIRVLLPRPPDLVASGINNGGNLGDDVTYSGTVGGAYEGMLLGSNAIAFSAVTARPLHTDAAAAAAASIARNVLENGLPPNVMLNVNIPDVPHEQFAGVAITRQGVRRYEDDILRREDPRGRAYYWIGGQGIHEDSPGTDIEAINQGKISITPLHRDLTDFDALEGLAARGFHV